MRCEVGSMVWRTPAVARAGAPDLDDGVGAHRGAGAIEARLAAGADEEGRLEERAVGAALEVAGVVGGRGEEDRARIAGDRGEVLRAERRDRSALPPGVEVVAGVEVELRADDARRALDVPAHVEPLEGRRVLVDEERHRGRAADGRLLEVPGLDAERVAGDPEQEAVPAREPAHEGEVALALDERVLRLEVAAVGGADVGQKPVAAEDGGHGPAVGDVAPELALRLAVHLHAGVAAADLHVAAGAAVLEVDALGADRALHEALVARAPGDEHRERRAGVEPRVHEAVEVARADLDLVPDPVERGLPHALVHLDVRRRGEGVVDGAVDRDGRAERHQDLFTGMAISGCSLSHSACMASLASAIRQKPAPSSRYWKAR
jgi:hypothetical protein